ncbi:hypothetical protein CAEBREN_06142 [Caenorhabditis brenneri]|uniref:Uncharacterized protein n=1 Tax=Caenorhabditis brenneri TaxID=135651 RepID=G0M9V8_CAEBE|nr:hypothetical protein CAEBREN_06142 [Caenorhabditis brenneri]
MAKTKVTTEDPFSELYEFNALYKEVYEKFISFFIGYGVLFLLLALLFLGLLVPYVKAFTKHSGAFGQSPFLPLVNHSNSMIKRFYPIFIIFVVAFIVLYAHPGTGLWFVPAMLISGILLLAIKSFVSVYQSVIAIVSFQTVMSSRDPHGTGWKFTRSRLIALTTILYIIAILREFLLFFYIIFVMILDYLLKSESEIDIKFMFLPTATGDSSYERSHTFYQFVLFIGMFSQYFLKPQITSNHLEQIILFHTKIMGAMKLVIYILYIVSIVTKFQNEIAYMIFVTIDILLVPLVIEITEIRIDPNVAQIWEMKSQQPKV